MPVAIVVSSGTPSRLMATKPLSPRENATALAPSSHQWFTSLPATSFRKETILRMYGSRCSHTHSPAVAVSRLGGQGTSLVLPSASDGGAMWVPARQANAQPERIDGSPQGGRHIPTC